MGGKVAPYCRQQGVVWRWQGDHTERTLLLVSEVLDGAAVHRFDRTRKFALRRRRILTRKHIAVGGTVLALSAVGVGAAVSGLNGGASLSGGVGRITGTVLGTLILGVVTSGFTFLRIDAYYQEIVKGGIIVAAVIADQYRHRAQRR